MDPEKARELLARERDRIEHALSRLSAPCREELAVREKPTDSGSSINEEFRRLQLDDLLTELAAVKNAEERLAAGSYGISVDSGKPIPDKRLEAFPTAERTVEEQERFEDRPG